MTMSGPAYCLVADVVQILTSFNFGGTPGDIDPSIVQAAIGQASAKVSAWTGQDWGTDNAGNTVAAPDIIQSITLNIAAYYATLSYRKNKPLENNDPVLLRYQDAVADLKAIQEGMINPNPVTPNKPSGSPGRRINTNPATFTPYDSGTVLESGRVIPDQWPGYGRFW